MPSLFSFVAIIFSSLGEVVDTFVYKKVSELSIKYRLHTITMPFIDYTFMLIFFFLPLFFFPLGQRIWSDFILMVSNTTFLLCILGIVLCRIFGQLGWTTAYGNEKISVLAPYAQLSSILAVIFGFILFRDTTDWRTFVFSMIALTVLFVSNLGGTKIQFNKYCLILTFSELCAAVRMLLAAYILIVALPLSVIFSQLLLGLVVVSLYIFLSKKKIVFPSRGPDRRSFFVNMGISNLVWTMSTVLSMFLFSEVGVTLTVLLSMSTLIISFIASYILYRDRPSNKDIIVSILISVCIIAGSVFSPSF